MSPSLSPLHLFLEKSLSAAEYCPGTFHFYQDHQDLIKCRLIPAGKQAASEELEVVCMLYILFPNILLSFIISLYLSLSCMLLITWLYTSGIPSGQARQAVLAAAAGSAFRVWYHTSALWVETQLALASTLASVIYHHNHHTNHRG